MNMMYNKRSGTSGISGQLYETKLISLILFRLLHDDSVEDFYLASNMDDIGVFDDICLKIKIAKHDRPIVCFIQVKHKENDDKFLTFDKTNDLTRLSNSIGKIKQMCNSKKSQNIFMTEDSNKTDYLFILYTNAKYDGGTNNESISRIPTPLNDLIVTGDNVACQAHHTEKDINELATRLLNDEIKILVEHFTKFLNENDSQSMCIMNDEVLSRYHVILAEKVVDISDIQVDQNKPDLEYRILTFRNEFFKTDDKFISIFKKYLYEQLLRIHFKLKNNSKAEHHTEQYTSIPEEFISSFLAHPSANTLSPLIGTYIDYKNEKLKFVSDRPDNEMEKLKEINVSPLFIKEAKLISVKNKLLSMKLKVPMAFGNVDLTIRGNPKEIKIQINYLTNIIQNLCKMSLSIGPYKIITIDKTTEDGNLSSNEDFSGTVGNILIYDDSIKLLKFVDDDKSLKSNAKSLYSKLNNRIGNLQKYRVKVKIDTFPTLSLDFSDVAREFFNTLSIYPNQGSHNEVEEILKREIGQYHSPNTRNVVVKTDTIFFCFHNKIQKWWMAPKTGTYLTKAGNLYQRVIDDIVLEPQISALQSAFMITNIKYFKYKFCENALNSIQLFRKKSKVIIVTSMSTLMAVKVIQYYKNRYHNGIVVLDLECILNLPINDFKAMGTELEKTDKLIIIICESIAMTRILHKRLNALTEAVEKKKVVFITNKIFQEIVQECFACCDILNNEILSVNDLTPESQKDLIENTVVLFQGQEIGLHLLLGETSVASIRGSVLNKIFHNETLVVGESFDNKHYEEIKHLYIERTITLNSPNEKYNSARSCQVKTFDDIKEDVVLITAEPGIGKSILMTHLAFKTKERNKNLEAARKWILKLNLLDYSEEFFKWQKNKTIMSTIEIVKFLCHIVLKDFYLSICLEEAECKVNVKYCNGDEWANFVLNIFLLCYNNRKLTLVFDGFDEICPHYKDSVIRFFDIIRYNCNKVKMWVTSRRYCDIMRDLKTFKSYAIECFDNTERKLYLTKFWQTRLRIEELNNVQINNLISFCLSNKRSDQIHIMYIYCQFYYYVMSHFPLVQTRDSIDTLKYYDDVINYLERTEETYDVEDNWVGTPLLLYLIADYFVNVANDNDNKWDDDINMYSLYEMITDTKLKKILYEDKNKMDVYNPDIITKYEKERDDCIDLHKKMAAYALLGDPIFSQQCTIEEFQNIGPFLKNPNELESMISIIQSGREKTGLITHVINDWLIFIHRSFTEYFTAEYLCDILKSSNYDLNTKKLLFTLIEISGESLTEVHNFLIWKRDVDKELDNIIKDIENELNMPVLWLYEDAFISSGYPYPALRIEERLRLINSSPMDYEDNCLDEFNTNDFIYHYHAVDEFERSRVIEKFIVYTIGNMKPHLKKYFNIPLMKNLVYKNYLLNYNGDI